MLALKGNQALFYEEVREYFTLERLKELQKEEKGWYKTVEKEHGGLAIREYYITEDTKWYSEKKNLGMIKTVVWQKQVQRICKL